MRNSLFMGIGIALTAGVMASGSAISAGGSDGARVSSEERCMVSFSAAQQNVCTGSVTLANPDLAALGEIKNFANSTLRLVKFDGPITEQRRAAVEAYYDIVGYAPHFAYIVRAKSGNVNTPRIEGQLWTGPFLPAFKLDLNLANELKGAKIAEAAGVTEIVVSMHSSSDRAGIESAVMNAPGLTFVNTITAGPETRVVARFDRATLRTAVEQLAADPAVAAIGFRWPMQLVNSQADWVHQSNVNSPSPLRPVFDRGLYGCGQIVGELDTGLHIANCAFNDAAQAPPVNNCTTGASCAPIASPNNAARKVIAYYKWSGLTGNTPTDPHGHGTHVAGSILGQNPATPVDCATFTSPGGNTDLDGTAPGAKLVMQETGSDLAYLNSQGGNPYHAANIAYQNGARLHSNSWGGGCVNPTTGACVSGCTVTYDAQSRDADNVTRDRDDLVLLFAAGNDASTCPAGNNVGSPGNAKNVITIGATGRGTAANGMASFSSRGPTNDSRTKPDITAQGSSIVSAGRNACGTATMSGTSMATPTAAGLAALVREYLQRGFYPTGQKVAGNAIANPSGALVKAILIAGAMPMTGTGAGTSPGQSQGWGRILLDDSLYFNGDGNRLYIHDASAGLATGGQDTHTLTVTAGTPLNIALTWTDVAAAVNANPALVNGLRLEVVAPNGDVWTQKLPASTSPSNANPSQSTATTNYDNRNNVHRISFANPAAGTYSIRVRGINVPTGPQKYALAATGNFQTGTGTNVPPVANFSSSVSGLVANFTDSSTDSDGTIASRSWNFGDSGTSTATSPSHTYASAGTYTVTLTVTDDDGATHTKTSSVTVTSGPGNVAPVANFSSTTSGLTANFTDTSTDSDGTIASRSWNFGDGGTSTVANPSRTYAAAGTYTVTLTVTDDDGATNTKTSSVTVTVPSDTVLQNGVAKTGLAIGQGAGLSFTMVVPAGATGLKFVTSGGTGDADLYVKFGSAASTTTYDCKSDGSTNAETCNIATAQAGTYHVFVYGYAAVSNLSLTGSFTTTTATALQNGVPRTGLSGATGSTQLFTLAVPAGATNLRFALSGGTGDADMYVRFGSAPTTSTYDCRPYLPGNAETCNITTAQAGTYYVMVRGYSAFSGTSLTGSFTP